MKEHEFTLKFDDEDVLCTPDDTALYVHGPGWEHVDHLFRTRENEERERVGAYIWRAILGDEEFKGLCLFIKSTGRYAMHYYPEPVKEDMLAYMEFKDEEEPPETGRH